jgi:tartrate dehydratase alpha subunit/fumarate hydratase class I-like protein
MGLTQSKSQPGGIVKIRTNANNNSNNGIAEPVATNTLYKQVMAESIQARKNTSDVKNPAKSLNATINLEQMLNGSKSGRLLP